MVDIRKTYECHSSTAANEMKRDREKNREKDAEQEVGGG